jgi:hypothetical protein
MRVRRAIGTMIAALLAKDHASFGANFAESGSALLKVIAAKACGAALTSR